VLVNMRSGVAFFLIFLCQCLLGAPNAVAERKAVDAAIEVLSKELEGHDWKNEDISEIINKLLVIIASKKDIYNPATTEGLTSAVEKIQAVLADPKARVDYTNSDLRKALIAALPNTFAKAYAGRYAAAIGFLSDSLNKVSENATDSRSALTELRSSTAIGAKLTAIANAVDNINSHEPPAVPPNRLIELLVDRLSRVTQLIDEDADMDARADLKKELAAEGDNAAKKALEAFNDAMAEYVDLKIHVVRSWYGNLQGNWSEGEQCDATNTMRAKCQGQSECEAPAATDKVRVDPVALCGFDPAPNARGRARGLVVQYSCQRGGREHWEALARYPLIDPDTGETFNSVNRNLTSVVLRSSGMKLRCPYPVARQ
jgi:hypothetical protein